MVLNDQVEHIKEFKTRNYREKTINMHRKTNSIDKSRSFEQKFKGPKRKVFENYCGMTAIDLKVFGKWNLVTSKSSFLAFALKQDIPVLKFN
jgi:hypothetical protein